MALWVSVSLRLLRSGLFRALNCFGLPAWPDSEPRAGRLSHADVQLKFGCEPEHRVLHLKGLRAATTYHPHKEIGSLGHRITCGERQISQGLLRLIIGARNRNRTGTAVASRGILSPLCLPISPSGRIELHDAGVRLTLLLFYRRCRPTRMQAAFGSLR